MIENRLHPRAVVRLEADIYEGGDDSFRRVVVHDLSASGARVYGRVPFAIQSEVRLRVRLPASPGGPAEPVELPCLVVRAGARVPPDSAMPFFGGLHFLALPDATLRRLQAVVWNLLHPSGD